MREFNDESGRRWQVLAVECTVAHGKQGACLAFRPADDADAEAVPTSVTFNGMEAADFAIRTLGETELRRRLRAALTVHRG